MKRYDEKFKLEAVKQVVEYGYNKQEVSKRLGVAYPTLVNWVKKLNPNKHQSKENESQKRIKELEKENQRLKMERDILKKAAAYLSQESL